MIINKINMSNKLLEFLIPIVEEYGIKDVTAIKSICDKIVDNNPGIMLRITTSNIIKNEMFDTMTNMCELLKIELMNLDELKNISLSQFNEICSNLPKAVISFNNACTKIEYSFVADIDSNNEEYIEITNKSTNRCDYKFIGSACRLFISEIVKSLNNVVYLTPMNGTVISIDSYDGKNTKVSISLDLEDMITIVNLYTLVINTKFNKTSNKSFIFKLDSLDRQPDTDIRKNGLYSKKRSQSNDLFMTKYSEEDDDNFVKLSDIIPDWEQRTEDSH